MKAIIFLYHQKPLTGIKGRIQTRTVEIDDSKRQYVEVVAEKVTFLSGKRQEEVD